MDIELTSADRVLSEAQLQDCNFASITLGAMFSSPESWTVANAGGYNYVAAMSLPMSADVRRSRLFLLI